MPELFNVPLAEADLTDERPARRFRFRAGASVYITLNSDLTAVRARTVDRVTVGLALSDGLTANSEDLTIDQWNKFVTAVQEADVALAGLLKGQPEAEPKEGRR